jgi:hypothetical protein
VLLLLLLLLLAPWPAAAAEPTPGECATEAGGGFRCLYRSGVPSAGIVAVCRSERDCRVGYYAGDPREAIWLEAPPGMAALPRPEVTWLTAMLAQVRLDCGPACAWHYFFEVRRQRLSKARAGVLAVDVRRLLYAASEERTLVVRQIFSGREVYRIARDWAPAGSVGEVISAIRFDPDGRLTFTWLRGAERAPVSERVSIPSLPR